MTTKKKSASKGSSGRASVGKKSAGKSGSMTASAKTKRALSPEEELAAMVAELEAEEVGGSNLSSLDRAFLGRLLRFLSGIQERRYIKRAFFEGYDDEEHAEGWRHFEAGSGRHRKLHLAFEGDFTPDALRDPDKQRIFDEVDRFENLWFPRARAIIDRVVPDDQVERFQRAFFRDLSQQPAGPLVIDSVSVFLDRVEALETSREPGAQEVRAKLRARGLTEKHIAAMRVILDSVKTAKIAIERRSEEAREADRAQKLGMKEARKWWKDWATTLRPRFDVREQILLGLTEMRINRVPPAEGTPPG
ncbi:MAG: hypothetical protein H5U40_03425, partial [Polyangiaceae bacterium]|nr:hypothetical protein [Polyangiaceae bacterium]